MNGNFWPTDELRTDAASASTTPCRAANRLKLEKLCRLCRRNRRGAAVVEFAVVAPVFFAFVLGMVEIGRAVMVQQILTNASREGARLGVLDDQSNGDVESLVDNYLNAASISAGSVQVTVDPPLPTAPGYNGPVSVTVSVPFDQVNWGPSPIFLQGATLSSTTVMRREGIQ